MPRRLLTLLLLLLAAGCSDAFGENEPVVVSVAGERPTLADPNRAPPRRGAALLLEGMAPGLVTLDAEGQVEPALARRWIVLDDGVSYIFRLADRHWRDGSELTAAQIVSQLRAARAPDSRNRLRPLLRDIELIEAVTPEIVEIVLRHPRSDFLQLLAQPDLAVLRGSEGLGWLEIAGANAERVQLRARREPADEEDLAEGEAPAEAPVRALVYFEPMPRAVARFELGRADVVLGGTLLDLIYAEAIEPSNDQLLFDPVQGLFGLGFVPREGFLADGENRDALSMAISRRRIMAAFDRIAAERQRTIIPEGVTELRRLTLPDWYDVDIEARRAYAADIVARWRGAGGEIPPLRVAIPASEGGRRMFAEFRAAWRTIGIDAVMVAPDRPADLVLVDRVAPSEAPDWYLAQFRCGSGFVCSETLDRALDAMRAAPDA
ncbi:MAG: ABC transporter substrate-binding protein, partial [Sphingomonadaceae bacterium]|nr:ABC transporter substrate-binding protein [Sphingomonadaceae bacterium]